MSSNSSDEKPDINRKGEPLEMENDEFFETEDGKGIYIHGETHTNVDLFYTKAKEEVEKARELEEDWRGDVEALPGPLKQIKGKEFNRRVMFHTANALLNVALTLEALANYYGANRRGMTPEEFKGKEKEERLPTPEKFEDYVEKVTGKPTKIDPDTKGAIRKIFRMRGDLTHYKPELQDPTDPVPPGFVSFQEAEKALVRVEEVLDYLKEAAPDFKMDLEDFENDELKGYFKLTEGTTK